MFPPHRWGRAGVGDLLIPSMLRKYLQIQNMVYNRKSYKPLRKDGALPHPFYKEIRFYLPRWKITF
jgi:hypothetical protein